MGYKVVDGVHGRVGDLGFVEAGNHGCGIEYDEGCFDGGGLLSSVFYAVGVQNETWVVGHGGLLNHDVAESSPFTIVLDG